MVWQWFELSADQRHDRNAGFVLNLEAPLCPDTEQIRCWSGMDLVATTS